MASTFGAKPATPSLTFGAPTSAAAPLFGGFGLQNSSLFSGATAPTAEKPGLSLWPSQEKVALPTSMSAASSAPSFTFSFGTVSNKTDGKNQETTTVVFNLGACAPAGQPSVDTAKMTKPRLVDVLRKEAPSNAVTPKISTTTSEAPIRRAPATSMSASSTPPLGESTVNTAKKADPPFTPFRGPQVAKNFT